MKRILFSLCCLFFLTSCNNNAVTKQQVIEGQGTPEPFSVTTIESSEAMSTLAEIAKAGNSTFLAHWIEKNLINAQGGIVSRFDLLGKPDETVLSESQGLMMNYAVGADDKDLFEKLFAYSVMHMNDYGLCAWSNDSSSNNQTNALLDDLRILNAIINANEKWGGYSEVIQVYSSNLLTYNTENNQLIDFFDTKEEKKASRFTLCYADFEILKKLTAIDPRWEAIEANAETLVLGGLINESFPLFYSWYNFEKKGYETSDLHMAEQLITLYHLSEINSLPENTANWLWNHIHDEDLYPFYSVNGKPAEENNYHSTAIYAITALIALSEENWFIAAEAFAAMEQLRIKQTDSSFFKIFGNPDGSGIYAFDQCCALLAYQQAEKLFLTSEAK